MARSTTTTFQASAATAPPGSGRQAISSVFAWDRGHNAFRRVRLTDAEHPLQPVASAIADVLRVDGSASGD